MNLTVTELAKMIDQTLLKAFATEDDLKKHCETAMEYNFKTVAINCAPVPFCKEILKDSDVICDAAVGFPLGQATIESKVFETIDVIEKGALEVDYVINIGQLKGGNLEYIEDEMRQIVKACRDRSVTSKVIFETCYLTDEEKVALCEIALKVRPDFVKTSTGFGTGGATIEDIKLMKSVVKDEIKIKASGGIRTTEDAINYINAGAQRLGTSCGVEIIEGYKKIV